ncbi:hypothetical protein D3C76_1024650 [compost metagenome]
MAQHGFVRTKAQREANFTHPTRRCRPGGRCAVQLRQPFVVGKARNTKIALRHTFYAQQTLFPRRAQQRQPCASM